MGPLLTLTDGLSLIDGPRTGSLTPKKLLVDRDPLHRFTPDGVSFIRRKVASRDPGRPSSKSRLSLLQRLKPVESKTFGVKRVDFLPRFLSTSALGVLESMSLSKTFQLSNVYDKNLLMYHLLHSKPYSVSKSRVGRENGTRLVNYEVSSSNE